jgi:DNA-binding transcriptional LysR family regulator
MQRGLDDLSAFLMVAREGSFTKAAAKLGVSQSALSYTIKELEARLKLQLLTRTTRSVAPTAAGERLLHHVGPRLAEIEAELAALSELREKPSGTIRITATEYATHAILLPKLAKLLRDYPDIKLEIISDYGLTDIVAQRFDAGVRNGEQVAKDMIAVRIAPDARMAVVGAASYFRDRPAPKKPQDLVAHIASICACLPMAGSMPGSSKKGRASSMCGSKANWSSTPRRRCSMRSSPVSAWPICRRIWCSPISPKPVSSACSRIGAHSIPAITSITRAGASPRPPSRSW